MKMGFTPPPALVSYVSKGAYDGPIQLAEFWLKLAENTVLAELL